MGHQLVYGTLSNVIQLVPPHFKKKQTMETPLAGRLSFFLPRPTLQLFLEKVIFQRHRRSSEQSRRSVSPSLPPSVGQRGRPRVAGAERNTTPRQRKGGKERARSVWVSGKSLREGERTGVGTFVRFWSAAVGLSLRMRRVMMMVRRRNRPCDMAATNGMNI